MFCNHLISIKWLWHISLEKLCLKKRMCMSLCVCICESVRVTVCLKRCMTAGSEDIQLNFNQSQTLSRWSMIECVKYCSGKFGGSHDIESGRTFIRNLGNCISSIFVWITNTLYLVAETMSLFSPNIQLFSQDCLFHWLYFRGSHACLHPGWVQKHCRLRIHNWSYLLHNQSSIKKIPEVVFF